MEIGKLDRRIQFRRTTLVDGGMSTDWRWNVDSPEADNHGSPVWAAKRDVSDAEKWRASEVQAQIGTRFTVRWSSFTSGITPKDRLACEGVTYEITGVRETGGRRRFLEISAVARADQ